MRRALSSGPYNSWFRIFRAKEVPHGGGQLLGSWLNLPHNIAFLRKLVLLFALNSSCLSAILFESILLRMMIMRLTLHS